MNAPAAVPHQQQMNMPQVLDGVRIGELIKGLTEQRETALNQVVNLRADLAHANIQLNRAQKLIQAMSMELEAARAELAALRPPPPPEPPAVPEPPPPESEDAR